MQIMPVHIYLQFKHVLRCFIFLARQLMKNVLIVDDEISLLLSIKAGFEPYKDRFNLFTAEDGKKAIGILKSNPIDLVVTDIRMPEMGGFELLVYMNANFPSIPAIVMSAYGTREIEGQFESIGIDGFLDKPVDFNKLVESIEEGLQRSSQSGTMTGISVGSFLQLIEMEEKTCLFEVCDQKKRGLFFFNQGRLHDAVCGTLVGEEAAIEMVLWNRVRLSFKNLPAHKIAKRINSELMAILMEAARRKDEKLNEKDLNVFDETLEENFISLNADNELLPPIESKKVIEPEWITPECPGPTVLLSQESQESAEPYLPECDDRRTSNQSYAVHPLKQIADLFKNMSSEMNGVMIIALMDMDGIVIAEHNLSQISSDAFAAKSSMIVGLLDKSIKDIKGAGEFEEIIIQASNVWMVCRLVAKSYYLGLVVNRESTLGNVRLVIGKYLDKIRQLL
jgi:CheY-like chemotaxis protein/predicted regulator of Ras-like GTPase activity (Roadblock/LC7/MglB family)